MKQLNLIDSKPNSSSYKSQDYVLVEGNVITYRELIIEDWCNTHCKILYGAPITGKTHLAYIWCKENNAKFLQSLNNLHFQSRRKCYIIENIENISNETNFLHCFNLVKEHNSKLLLTTSVLPKFLPYKLPDLRSRILSAPLLKLVENNEDLLRIILVKEFSSRQIKVSKEVIEYMIRHITRSTFELAKMVEVIDTISMQKKRGVTVPFIKEIIRDLSTRKE